MAEGKADEPVDIRNENRLRLRPWLMSRLHTGEVPGLEWIDKKQGVFRIPWNHGGKHDWTPDKGKIFKDWALHTGKFVDGVDEPNHAKWKTNLRCALHKAKDIEELKTRGRANDDRNPYRVYKFKKLKKKGGIPIPEVLNDTEDEERNYHGPVIPTFISTYSSTSSSGSSHPFSSGSVTSNRMSIGNQPPSNSSSSISAKSRNDNEPPMLSPYSEDSSNHSQAISESSRELDPAGELDYTILNELENIECGKLPSDLNDLMLEQLTETIDNLNEQNPNNLFDKLVKKDNLNEQNPLVDILNTNVHSTTGIPTNNYELGNNQTSGYGNVALTNQNMNNPGYALGQENLTLFGNPPSNSTQMTSPYPPSTSTQMTSPYPPSNSTQTTSPYQSPESSSATNSPAAYSDYRSPSSQASSDNQVDANNVHMTSIPDSPEGSSAAAGSTYTKFSSSGLQYHRCNVRFGHEMYIEIVYKNNVMKCCHVDKEKGCRLFPKSFLAEQSFTSDVKEVLYGAEINERLSLEMPEWPPNIGNDVAVSKGKGILENADRGIVLECINGSLYITRYCKTKLYSNSNFAKIIQRSQQPCKIKLLDFENDFVPSFERFKKTRLDRPSSSVCLFFGQQNVSEQQADKVLVMVRVTSCRALDMLLREAEEREQSASIHISSPNEYDEFADLLKSQLKM